MYAFCLCVGWGGGGGGRGGGRQLERKTVSKPCFTVNSFVFALF